MEKINIQYPLGRDQIIELLQQHDIQPTQQRVEIAEVLFTQAQHVSADQVMDRVNQLEAKVSKATVYNTLGLFAQKGLINEVLIDPSRIFYDSNTVPHHHFYNVDTGELSDISPQEVEFSRLPQTPAGTQTTGVDVIVRVRSHRNS